MTTSPDSDLSTSALAGPVLVTGASGFLGETICRTLLERGQRVVGTYLTHPVDIPRGDFVPVDLKDARAVDRLVRDLAPGWVIHAAALTDVGACERDPASAEAAHIDATRHVADAITRRAPTTPLVFVSSDLVYEGTAAPYRVGDETKPLSLYGSLKLRAEEIIRTAQNHVILRAALMFGPATAHGSGFLGWMRRSLDEGKALTLFQDEWRTPVNTVDVGIAAERLAAGGHWGTWNLGGPERLSRLDIGRVLAKAMGMADEGASLLVPARREQAEYAAPRTADVSLVSEETWLAAGHKPRSLAESLPGILAGKH